MSLPLRIEVSAGIRYIGWGGGGKRGLWEEEGVEGKKGSRWCRERGEGRGKWGEEGKGGKRVGEGGVT